MVADGWMREKKISPNKSVQAHLEMKVEFVLSGWTLLVLNEFGYQPSPPGSPA